MLHVTRRAYRLVLFSLLLFTGLTGCQDKDPKPSTGTISGTVSPRGSVTTVQAIDAGGLTFPVTPSATDGAFSITDLQPGAYILRTTPATGYLPPNDRQINVEAGQKANAGTIVVTSDGSFKGGTISWTVGGTTYSVTNPQGGVDLYNRMFDVSAISTTGNATDQLNIGLGSNFTGAGDYTVGNSVYTSAMYERRVNGQLTGFYRSNTATNSGMVRVSAFDAAAGTMSGTFNLVIPADPSTGTTGSVTLANGTFSIRF